MGAYGVNTAARACIDRLVAFAALAPEESWLAGRVSGGLFLIGAVTLVPLTVLPDVTHAHRASLFALAGVAGLWGAASVFIFDWDRGPRALIHLSAVVGVVVICAAVASSGAARSPAWIYLLFVVVFAAYFLPSAVALAYIAICICAQAAPLLYDPAARDGAFLAQLEIAAPAYVALGGVIASGRELRSRLRLRAERLAAEQGSLRQIATAVVGGEPPEHIYKLVAQKAAALLGAAAAGILRFDGEDQATLMGSWSERGAPSGHAEPGHPGGTVVAVPPGSDADRARHEGVPVRVLGHPPDSAVGRLGRSSIVAPVRVGGQTWGVLAVTAGEPERLTAADEQRLMAFGDMLATAITAIEDRAKLAAQASSDPLTGLANHRTLQERLAAEVARAVRHARSLAVAVIDIDHFKHVNDISGHEIGDEMLVRVARCLRNLARVEDTLGRVGGDEFAWILPETTREQALVAVERARRLIAQSAPSPYRMTVSAGICDSTVTQDPAELVHLADGALYWSKAHGRNQSWIYDPSVIDELSAQERAKRLERSRALLGLRALARAIDAKDPATREHSERVAALAGKLARTTGWSLERAMLLSEAALVHDVGKIGVPDALLRKAGPLSDDERAQIRSHAELSTRIVEGVLASEQVEWIRTHHERPDGDGYPDGLRGEEIPEGAALLAIADAWDVMTVSRPYSMPKGVGQALEECRQLVGEQFTEEAVRALLELDTSGELELEHPRRQALAGGGG